MAKRHIKDEDGIPWDVWDVYPDKPMDVGAYDRRGAVRGGASGFRASVALLDPELMNGWLCFQSGDVRRRFAPVPPGWEELPDGVLRVMLSVGRAVRSLSTAGRAATADVSE